MGLVDRNVRRRKRGRHKTISEHNMAMTVSAIPIHILRCGVQEAVNFISVAELAGTNHTAWPPPLATDAGNGRPSSDADQPVFQPSGISIQQPDGHSGMVAERVLRV